MVRLTDRPDMTLVVYRGRKTTMQQQQPSKSAFSVVVCYTVIVAALKHIETDSATEHCVYIVVTIVATQRPVEVFHLHTGMTDYFHHGGQRFQNFGSQPTKWIKLFVSVQTRISSRSMSGIDCSFGQ